MNLNAVDLTLQVLCRELPPPKKQPRWIMDLSGKSSRSWVKKRERTVRSNLGSMAPFVDPSKQAQLLVNAQKLAGTNHLLRVDVLLKVQQDSKPVTVITWNTWDNSWKVTDAGKHLISTFGTIPESIMVSREDVLTFLRNGELQEYLPPDNK